jgi:predicted Zn finger-like uncharacterized protein
MEKCFCVAAALEGNARSSPDRAPRGFVGLIVTCQECSTSFQLDETLIPESGAQVRCSRCKFAFFLPCPSASPSEAVHSIVEEAAQDSMSNVPPATSDAPEPASESPGAAVDAESDEEDWEFSEEVRSEDDEEVDSRDSFGSSEDFSGGLDADALLAETSGDGEVEVDEAADSVVDSVALDSGEGSGLELESGPEQAEPVRDKSNFGSVDDFSSLRDDDVAAVDPGSESASDLESPTSSTPAAAAQVDESNETTDDLGDPESWDLVGNDDSTVGKAGSGSAGMPIHDEDLGSDVAMENDPEESFFEDEIGPTSRLWQVLARVGSGIGWVATIALVGSTLVLGLRTEGTRWAQSPQTISVGAITAETTSTNWVETSRSGFVLIVEGQVRNTGSTPTWPGRVQFALLDRRGGRLNQAPILAGERLAETILREASPAQLLASIDAAASRLRDTKLAPGESRNFSAVMLEDQLPEAARRVLLELSDPVEAEWDPPVQVEEVSDFSP